MTNQRTALTNFKSMPRSVQFAYVRIYRVYKRADMTPCSTKLFKKNEVNNFMLCSGGVG